MIIERPNTSNLTKICEEVAEKDEEASTNFQKLSYIEAEVA